MTDQDKRAREAIENAVARAGNQSELARMLNISPQSVQQMVAKGQASHRQVIPIETCTGVSRHDLRPDLYPEPRGNAA